MRLTKLIALFILMNTIVHAQVPAKQLQSSYKNNSIQQLQQFFENWHNAIPAITNTEFNLLNDTAKQAYKVFEAFYQPFNIKALGGSEWGNDIYSKVKYLIVQNDIKIYSTSEKIYYSDHEVDSMVVKQIRESHFSDSVKNELLKRTNGHLEADVLERFSPNELDDDRKSDSITTVKNFRPLINCGNVKPLYLTPEYDIVLNAFLGNTHLKLGAGGIMNPARSTGESNKRQKFLEKFIKIWYGHWGGYWQLYSYPVVTSLIFDKQMQYAIIQFQLVYEGGEAILKNNNGIWQLVSSKRTWIE